MKKINSAANADRSIADWVSQADAAKTERETENAKNAPKDMEVYDATSEEIIATHDDKVQEEGVDEEWSGDGAENKDFAADDEDELA